MGYGRLIGQEFLASLSRCSMRTLAADNPKPSPVDLPLSVPRPTRRLRQRSFAARRATISGSGFGRLPLPTANSFLFVAVHSQHCLDAFCRFGLHVWQNVRIDVDGKGTGGMTKLLRYDLRWNAGSQGQGCRRVAQIIEAHHWQPGLTEKLLEPLHQIIAIDGPTHSSFEDLLSDLRACARPRRVDRVQLSQPTHYPALKLYRATTARPLGVCEFPATSLLQGSRSGHDLLLPFDI